jgi:hypothetical protein
MRRLTEEEAPLKAELRKWQTSAAARRFTRNAIGQDYAAALSSLT